MNRIIDVDLSSRKVELIELSEEILKKYIGGSGIGTKLLWDHRSYEGEPLSEHSPLVFMTGPFANTPALTSGRHALIFRSPLTGMFGESDCGGTWGPTLKRAGYDGIIVKGKAESPVYLWCNEEGVEIRNAVHVWGKDTYETEEVLRSETAAKAVTACIGPAGERQVKIASVMHDGRAARAAARCGPGALMGAKKLKAITVYGSKETAVHDRKALISALGKIGRTIKENMAGMTLLGTGGGLISFEELGSLPLQNWRRSERWQEGALKITGASMKDRIGSGNYGCERCIVRCGRTVKVESGPYAGLEGAGPEYESLASLGSLCLVSDVEAIAMANDLCNRYGLDTISTGSLIAFAMEAFESGIITSRDVDGLDLTWGNAGSMIEMVKMIGENRGFGATLALGVREAARVLGGGTENFAVHANGLEFPMHDPRAYMSLAIEYSTAARGACHLSGLSHAFERAITLPEIGLNEVPNRLDFEQKGRLTALSQDVCGMFDSLKICKFMLFGGLKLTHICEWYYCITGRKITPADFILTGERIFNLKRLFNLKCGYNPEVCDTVSSRILNLPKEGQDWKTRLPDLALLKEDYYKHRGWDERGIPTEQKLNSLGLRA